MTKEEIAKKMCELVQQKEGKEVQKAAVVKKFNDEIKGLEQQITQLANDYLYGQGQLFDDVAEMELVEDAKLLPEDAESLPLLPVMDESELPWGDNQRGENDQDA